MLEATIAVLVVGLILWLVYFLCSKLTGDTPLMIVGICLCAVFLLYAVKRLDLLDGVSF